MLVALNHDESIAEHMSQKSTELWWLDEIVWSVDEQIRQEAWSCDHYLVIKSGEIEDLLVWILLDEFEKEIPTRPVLLNQSPVGKAYEVLCNL